MTNEEHLRKFDSKQTKIPASPTKVIEGFELQEGYPNCCPYHKSIFENISNWWNIFPNCCPDHKEMAENGLIQKKDYNYVPEKILTCLAYFEYHLSKKINDDNWFNDIKHYIEHLYFSFGYPAIGFPELLNLIIQYIQHHKPKNWVFPEDRRLALITFFNKEMTKDNQKNQLNFELLSRTYYRWLKTVPDIDTFAIFKQLTGESHGNLILKKSTFNPYTKKPSTETLTNPELLETLLTLTVYVLSKIDTTQMIHDNSEYNAQLLRVKFMNEKHRIEQLKILEEYDESEALYLNLIEKWLFNENKHFKKLVPELNKLARLQQPLKIYIPIKEKQSDSNINNQDNNDNLITMAPKIFNNLLHGSLRPWLFDFSDIAKLGKKLKSANEFQLDSVHNINSSLSSLLADFPEYNALYQNQTQDIEFTFPHFNVDVPESYDLPSSFMAKLIEAETLRFYNEVLANKYIVDVAKDTQFQIGHKVLKSILGLIEELRENLNENNIMISPSLTFSDISVFTFVYLHNRLLALYFSIQYHYKDNLKIEYKDENEMYLYKFGVMECPVTLIEQTTTTINKAASLKQKSIPTPKKLTFGFNGDITKLKDIVKLLCLHFNFLNETVTTQEQFIEVFTTKDLSNSTSFIWLGCATNLFVEVQKHLQKIALNFTDAALEESNLFKTQNGNFLKAANIAQTRRKSKLKLETVNKITSFFS